MAVVRWADPDARRTSSSSGSALGHGGVLARRSRRRRFRGSSSSGRRSSGSSSSTTCCAASPTGSVFPARELPQIRVESALFGKPVPTVWLQAHLWHGAERPALVGLRRLVRLPDALLRDADRGGGRSGRSRTIGSRGTRRWCASWRSPGFATYVALSRPCRRGWRRSTATSASRTGSIADRVAAHPDRPLRRRCSSTGSTTRTTSPRCRRCTPRTRCSSRSTSGGSCRAGCARCSRSIRSRWRWRSSTPASTTSSTASPAGSTRSSRSCGQRASSSAGARASRREPVPRRLTCRRRRRSTSATSSSRASRGRSTAGRSPTPDGTILVDTGMIDSTPELDAEWGPTLLRVAGARRRRRGRSTRISTSTTAAATGGSPGTPTYVQRAELEAATSLRTTSTSGCTSDGADYVELDGDAELFDGVSVLFDARPPAGPPVGRRRGRRRPRPCSAATSRTRCAS